MAFSWSHCIICQKDTSEELRCPLRSRGADKSDPRSVYNSFLHNVSEFRDSLDVILPVSLTLPPDTNVDVLIEKEAVWHKSCHLQFSKSKLNKAKEKAARKRNLDQAKPEEEKATKTRKLSSNMKNCKENCILCDQTQTGPLHDVTTFATNENLRRMITELQDTTLLPKISGVDLIAAEAKYHLKCMTNLRNRYRSHLTRARQESCEEDEKIKESQAFIELNAYIEKSVENEKLFFLLSELHSLYVSRLQALGIQKQINRTRLKISILENFPDAQEQNDGKNVVIIFKKAIQGIVKEVVQQRDFSEDAMILAKVSAIVRKDIFGHEGFTFSGRFPQDVFRNPCQLVLSHWYQ